MHLNPKNEAASCFFILKMEHICADFPEGCLAANLFIDPYTEPGKSAEKKIKWIYNRVLSATNRAGKLRTLKQDQQTAGTQICAQFFGHNAPVKKGVARISSLQKHQIPALRQRLWHILKPASRFWRP